MLLKHTHFSWNPIHPHRDWRWLFIAFSVLFVAVIAWSAYLFFSSASAGNAVTIQPAEEQNPTARQLERVSSFFEER